MRAGDFRQQQRAVGRPNFEKAERIAGGQDWRESVSLRLPRRSAWILKAVQAAVLLRAPELRFRQGSCSTMVEFSPTRKVAFEPLRAALTGFQTSNAPIPPLVAALRGVLAQEGRPFSFDYWDGKERVSLHWNNQSLHLEREKKLSVRAVCKIGVGHGRRNYLPTVIEEAQELVRYAYTSPVPVRLDGRGIDFLGHSGFHNANRLSHGTLPPVDGESLLPPTGLDRSPGSPGAVWRLDQRLKLDDKGGLTALPNPSRCYWVVDGVVVGEERLLRLSYPTSLRLFLPASGLNLDPAGLSLQEGACGLRNERLMGALRQAWQAFRRTPPDPLPGPLRQASEASLKEFLTVLAHTLG